MARPDLHPPAGAASWACARSASMAVDGCRVLSGYAGAKISGPTVGTHGNAVADVLRSLAFGCLPEQDVPPSLPGRHVPGYTGHRPKCGACPQGSTPAARGKRGDSESSRSQCLRRPASEPQLGRASDAARIHESRFCDRAVYEAAFGRKPNPPPAGWNSNCPVEAKLSGATDVLQIPKNGSGLMLSGQRDPGFWRTEVHPDFERAFQRKGEVALEVALAMAAMRPKSRGMRSSGWPSTQRGAAAGRRATRCGASASQRLRKSSTHTGGRARSCVPSQSVTATSDLK